MALSVLEIFFAPTDDIFIGPTIGTKSVAMEAFCPMLVVLAVEGLGVQRDDRDLASAVGVTAVGWEGEDSGLIPDLRR